MTGLWTCAKSWLCETPRRGCAEQVLRVAILQGAAETARTGLGAAAVFGALVAPYRESAYYSLTDRGRPSLARGGTSRPLAAHSSEAATGAAQRSVSCDCLAAYSARSARRVVDSKLSPDSAVANPTLIVNLNSVNSGHLNSGHPFRARRHLSGPPIFWVSRIPASRIRGVPNPRRIRARPESALPRVSNHAAAGRRSGQPLIAP